MQTMKLKAKMQQNTKKIINQNTAKHEKNDKPKRCKT